MYSITRSVGIISNLYPLYTVSIIYFEQQFLIAKIKTNVKIVKASLLDYKQLKFLLDETRIELVSFNYSPTF